MLPWRQAGGAFVVLTPQTQLTRTTLTALAQSFGPIRLGQCTTGQLRDALAAQMGGALAYEAETRVPEGQSCRTWDARKARYRIMALLLLLLPALVIWPGYTLAAVTGVAVLALALCMGLKIAATLAVLLRPTTSGPVPGDPVHVKLPVVSLLVPLFREREIASHLIARLQDIDYPHDLLDVCLIVEDTDTTTQLAIASCALPDWCQLVKVPTGGIKTKPRALNYALTCARGTIIGIYDAEDAPHPQQIRDIVQRFAERGPHVACLQGVLDFYNTSENWITRCFTLEYATWFRLMLPGLQRLGLVLPLGGTTLFLRRDAIERVGGWDAHNVTEDADLGVRLARAGYQTEVVDTVTLEEANNHAWRWVKQRSRWLKGYAMTWAVHMAQPRALLRDLGLWRFFGVQVLFLGTLVQFLLAPLLWSFWLLLLGLPHPLDGTVPRTIMITLGTAFLVTEIINLIIAAIAARKSGRPKLGLWGPALQLYFPLATAAVIKGLWETLTKPFYWDKTAHGQSPGTVTLPLLPSPHPAEGAQQRP